MFDLVDNFVKTQYNLDKDMLNQLMQFQRNYVVDHRNLKYLPIQQNFDYDFLGYIQDGTALDRSCTCVFETTEDPNMSLEHFLENMYFARKRNFGKTNITRSYE